MPSFRSTEVGAPRWTLLWRCWMLAILFAFSGPAARADDEAWIQRIEKALTAVEVGVADLDKKTALPGTLVERIAALHARLIPLEKAVTIEPGSIAGTDELSACTMDATNLNSRWKAIVKARSAPKTPPKKDDGKQLPPPPPPGSDKPGDAPKPPPPPPPPPPPIPGDAAPDGKGDPAPGDASAPKKVGGRSWPKQIAFKATAKMSYVQTGTWIHVETEPYVYVDKFQLDGFSGKISFTLRASGLLRDVKSAVVRVAVRMKGQVTEVSDEYRLSDVTWTAEKAFGDDSIKSWVNYDDFKLSATPRWYAGGPRPVMMPLDAEAYVVSLVLPDGTAMTFETPEYNKPKK